MNNFISRAIFKDGKLSVKHNGKFIPVNDGRVLVGDRIGYDVSGNTVIVNELLSWNNSFISKIKQDKYGFYTIHCSNKFTIRPGSDLENGGFARFIIIGHPFKSGKYECYMISYIGKKSDPSFQLKMQIEKHIPFSKANKTIRKLANEAIEGFVMPSDVVDETGVNYISVDYRQTTFCDDAIYIKKNGDNYVVQVAITDVSSYINEGGKLDQHIKRLGESLYTPYKKRFLLPHELLYNLGFSTDRENLGFICKFEIDRNGNIINNDFYKAVIKLKKSISFHEVSLFFDTKKIPDPFVHNLVRVNENIRKNHRLFHGYIENSKWYQFDENRNPVDISTNTGNSGSSAIASLMVIANNLMTRFVEDNGGKCVYRVKDQIKFTPKLHEYLLKYNFNIKKSMIEKRSIINALDDNPELKPIVLTNLMHGYYSTTPGDHISSNSNRYSRFTSPLRRYADIVMQRALQSALDNVSYTIPDNLIEHLNKTENNNKIAEREISKITDEIIISNKSMIVNGIITNIDGDKYRIFIEDYMITIDREIKNKILNIGDNIEVVL